MPVIRPHSEVPRNAAGGVRRRALARWLFALIAWGWAPLGYPAAEAAPAQELRLYNWENYLDPAVAAEFARRTGVKIRQT
jgi:spermidine/putrescine-binding protein